MLVALFFLIVLPFWIWRFSLGRTEARKFSRGLGFGRKSWALHVMDNGIRSLSKALIGVAISVLGFLYYLPLGFVIAVLLLIGEVVYYWGGHRWLQKNRYVGYSQPRRSR